MKLHLANQIYSLSEVALDEDIYYKAIQDTTCFPVIFDSKLPIIQICKGKCRDMVDMVLNNL